MPCGRWYHKLHTKEDEIFPNSEKDEWRYTLTIVGRDTVIVGIRHAIFILPSGTEVTFDDALLYPDSSRTLISYQDIRKNGFHIETHEDNKEEYLLITKDHEYGKKVHEKIPSLSSGLYYTYIKPMELVAYKVVFHNVNTFQT